MFQIDISFSQLVATMAILCWILLNTQLLMVITTFFSHSFDSKKRVCVWMLVADKCCLSQFFHRNFPKLERHKLWFVFICRRNPRVVDFRLFEKKEIDFSVVSYCRVILPLEIRLLQWLVQDWVLSQWTVLSSHNSHQVRSILGFIWKTWHTSNEHYWFCFLC
jgi:hypothetical protein